MVAALFVETNGVYYGLPDVEPWDEERDARLYAGPWPVVAHPPCARWSRLAGFTEARFGYKRGEDGGCFEAALRAVRTYGGVLEHPAYSAAWARFDLPRPVVREGWTLAFDGGASCYVEQGRYGLPVKKATWLYAYGLELAALRWGYTPDGDGDSENQTEWGGMDSWRDKFKGRREGWTKARHRGGHYGKTSVTPPLFRDALLDMARSATREQKKVVAALLAETERRKQAEAWEALGIIAERKCERRGAQEVSKECRYFFQAEGVAAWQWCSPCVAKEARRAQVSTSPEERNG